MMYFNVNVLKCQQEDNYTIGVTLILLPNCLLWVWHNSKFVLPIQYGEEYFPYVNETLNVNILTL